MFDKNLSDILYVKDLQKIKCRKRLIVTQYEQLIYTHVIFRYTHTLTLTHTHSHTHSGAISCR